MAKSMELELVVAAKDKASRVLSGILQAVKKTGQATEQAARTSENASRKAAQSRANLGIRSEREIQREIQRTIASYNRLARSGTASAREIARAQEVARNKVRELNAEMGKTSTGQRVLGAGRAVGGMVAGAIAAKHVLTPAMNDRKQWDANVTNVALQAFGDKSASYIQTEGIRQIEDAVKNIVQNIGGTHDKALDVLNAMMVNGLDFDSANKMLPQAQIMQIAGEADADSIGSLIKVLGDYGFKGEQLAEAFNHAVRSGMDGKFEIADMVRELPSILSKATQAGFTGMKDFDYILAWLQSAANKAGANSEAANNVSNALEKMNAEDTKKRLEKLDNPTRKGKSVDWDNSKLVGRGAGKNPMEVMNLLAEQMLNADKTYHRLQAKLSKAATEEERSNIQAQLNLKRGMVFSQLLPDIQAKAGLVASADKASMQNYQASTQNKDLTTGLDSKRFTVTMGTDKAREEQKASMEFLSEGVSSSLNRAERAWNDFWINFGKENPEMLGMYADLKIALGAVAAAGAAAISLGALGGKGGLGGLGDVIGSGRSKGITGGGKFGNAMRWGTRATGVLGVVTMLSGSEDEMTQNRKREISLALNAVKTGNATTEQERLVYELNKASVEKYDKGNWFTRLTMSDSGVTQARRMVEQYEAKQADGNLANVASQVAGQLSVLASQTGRLNPNVAHRTKSQPSNKQADIRQKAETNRVLSTVKSNNAPIENEPANEPKAFSVPEWKKGNERVNASDSGGEQARRVLRGNGVKPTQGVAVAEVASQISVLASQQASTKGQVDSVNSVLAHYQADFAAFGQTILEGLQAGLAAQSHTIDNRITVELDGAVIAQKVSQQQFQFFKRG